MAELKESLEKAMERIGLKSQQYIDNLVDEMLKLDVKDVDVEKFNSWFNSWVNGLRTEKITSLGRYFMSVFKKQLENGTFKASDTSSTAATTIKDVSVEDFEKEWDEWCRLVEDLSLDPENPDVPGKGILIGELHCVDGVRGISTGDGGFVYLDGTVSQRFKKFEDLTIQEKEDLINAFDERNTRGHGRLIIADALIEKMKSLAGGSAV